MAIGDCGLPRSARRQLPTRKIRVGKPCVVANSAHPIREMGELLLKISDARGECGYLRFLLLE